MIRAQEAAKRAVELGDTSYVIQAMAKRNLDALPPDGPMTPAQELMHEAEKSFAAGDFPAALAKYAQAADADPRLYEAPLYAGDAALKKGDFLAANKWYARAITVNPNRETAYRYSGDLTLSLATLGSPTSFRAKILDSGAKAKYLKAIVAEPYNQRSWEGIKKWAKLRNATSTSPEDRSPGGGSCRRPQRIRKRSSFPARVRQIHRQTEGRSGMLDAVFHRSGRLSERALQEGFSR